ncbi:MAG: carbon storage regulator [Dehalococcoidia bacterium]
MLVLDRRLKEGFWIGDRIFVKVLGTGKRRVKLGVDAPDDLAIVRDELRARTIPNRNNNQHTLTQRRDPSG